MAKTDKQSNPRRPLPEAASARVDPRRTIDDVFQRLVHVLGKKPEDARLEIRDRLLRGAPLIALRVEGDVTDSNGVTTPPEGVTLPINPQSWEQMLLLRIREGKLVIEPGGNMIYPWDACSFVDINWSLVEELWPNPNRAGPNLPAPGSISASGTSSLKSAETLPGAVTSTARDSTDWIDRAVKQCYKELTGLSVRAACKLLAAWMSAGKVKNDKSPELLPAQKPIGWSRIKTIVSDQGLLPIKSAGK